MLSNEEATRIVTDVLLATLSADMVIDTQIEFVDDFDGQPIIRVQAKLSKPVKESELLFKAADEMRDRLSARGDERFVFLQQASSDPIVADEETAEGDLP